MKVSLVLATQRFGRAKPRFTVIVLAQADSFHEFPMNLAGSCQSCYFA